ncbi:TrlF family AAA-like ATPase [Pigmentibacter ruber]|uniref:TrlF family AAA-like ATPase n=1 Tax=Pigmentibacter ruber TaxID=2683196 RepID=UPI00131AE7BC|nr:AAA family ATPase [Pigmentibacter ruber]
MIQSNFTGAKWWKIDFHVHTPCSTDYKQKHITTEDWINKCLEKGLDCVVITDHNDTGWIDGVTDSLSKLKKQDEKYRYFYIFKGIELTVDEIHFILIFKDSMNAKDIERLIGGTFNINSALFYDAPNQERKIQSQFDWIDKIQENAIVIPAHIDRSDNGFFNIKNKPKLDNYLRSKQKFLAMEFKGNLDNIANEIKHLENENSNFKKNYDSQSAEYPAKEKLKNLKYISQKIEEYKKQNTTFILGSDSHNLDTTEELFTWVKMETPSFESLRLALHDGSDSVIRSNDTSENLNEIKHKYIDNIEIHNALFAGIQDPLNIKFNPWLNIIIGSRGSGKSSIFNFLKILSNPTVIDSDQDRDSFKNFFKERNEKENSGALKINTIISLTLNNLNNEYETFKYEHSDKKWTINNSLILKDQLKTYLPVKIFSQKEIFEICQKENNFFEYIKSFIQEELEKINEEIKDKFSTLKIKIEEINKFTNSVSKLESIDSEIKILEEKIKVIESTEYKDTINKYKLYHSLNESLNTSTDFIKENFINQLNKIPNKETNYNIQINSNLDEKTKNELTKWNSELTKLTSLLHENIKQINSHFDTLSILHENTYFYSNYIQIKKEYEELTNKYGASIQDFSKDFEKLNKLKKEQEKIESEKKALILLNEDKEKIKKDIIQLEQKKRELIKRKIDDINNNQSKLNNNFKKIKISYLICQRNVSQSFQNEIGTRNQRYSSFYLSEDEKSGFLFDTFLSSKNDNIDNIFKHIHDEKRKWFEFNPKNSAEKELKNILLNKKDELDLFFPEDTIKVEISKNKSFEPISNVSPGEKVAAFLELVMNIENKTLCIDQPEDDLDLTFISDTIIPLIKNYKKNQQVIIITHNANITINTGAENIIHLKFSGGKDPQIRHKETGALQNEKIRKAVCDVVEGGEKALQDRYYKIFKALSNYKP